MQDRISKTALKHYQEALPQSGKPGCDKDRKEWTVYAAILATTTTTTTTTTSTTRTGTSAPDGDDDCCWVVSSATGTKCTAIKSDNNGGGSSCWESSCLLHDSHAEVLARRGLVRVLWSEIQVLLQQQLRRVGNDEKPKVTAAQQQQQQQHQQQKHAAYDANLRFLLDWRIEQEDECSSCSTSTLFQLKKGVELHMYISDSPCGDASIYEIESMPSAVAVQGGGTAIETCTQFTGAKIVVSEKTGFHVEQCQEGLEQQLLLVENKDNNRSSSSVSKCRRRVVVVAREAGTQLVGKLRTKSGRSNLQAEQRSTSMSCSDKLVRWGVLGLQGCSLGRFLPHPIRLSSCVVGKDPRIVSKSTTSQQPQQQQQQQQYVALDRCLCRRIQCVITTLSQTTPCAHNVREFAARIPVPVVHIADTTFEFGKAAMEKEKGDAAALAAAAAHHDFNNNDNNNETNNNNEKKRKRRGKGGPEKKFPATGFSMNWNQMDRSVEVTVGARGLRQGKKPRQHSSSSSSRQQQEEYEKLESRLSRNQIQRLGMQTTAITELFSSSSSSSPPPDVSSSNNHQAAVVRSSYREWKNQNALPLILAVREELFQVGPLAGWLVGTGGGGET